MSIEKNTSIILSVTPYRESSVLATLYSEQNGRISVVAKGTRKSDRNGVPLERGMLVEHTIYLKPNRDLHQITDCTIRDFFPGIRYDLEKTALRDLLFDICLKALDPADSNIPLFKTIHEFLSQLDACSFKECSLLVLTAKALLMIAENLGFSPDLSQCGKCGTAVKENEPVHFIVRDGSLRCRRCGCPSDAGTLPVTINKKSLDPLSCSLDQLSSHRISIPVAQGYTLLRVLTDYCRYHFDIHRPLPSLNFLHQLYRMQKPAAKNTLETQQHRSSIPLYPSKETQCQTLP